MEFSLVSTVFNEAARLQQTISDIIQQTLQPNEIIITDAGSNDGTYEMLLEWKNSSSIPIIILQKHRCNVAEGRNLAIKATHYDLIVSTDFGCRFDMKWLESIVRPFEDSSIDVVGGAYTVRESEQITLAARAAYILANGYNSNYDSPSFIPSSRSIAYKKSVYKQIGGYSEWLTLAADDTIFGLEIKAKGFKVHISKQPYVYWGRHKVAKGFIKEAYRYGLGDGESGVNKAVLFKTISIFLACCALILNVLVIPFFLIFTKSITFKLLPIISLLLLLALFYAAYIRRWLKFKSSKYNIEVLGFGFILTLSQKFSYIKGYVQGFFFSTNTVKEQAKELRKRLKIV